MTNDNGFFELHDLNPGTSYQIIVSAKGFANWASPAIVLKPGQYLDLTSIKLQVAEVVTTVHAAFSTEQIATEQVRVEIPRRHANRVTTGVNWLSVAIAVIAAPRRSRRAAASTTVW